MTTLSQFFSTFLVNSLWEMTLIFAVAYTGSWIMRRSPARFRYRLWLGALALALGLPLENSLAPVLSRILFPPHRFVDVPGFSYTTHVKAAAPVFWLTPFWIYLLAACYLAFLAYRVIRFVRAWRQVYRLWNSAQPFARPYPMPSGAKMAAICSSALVRGPVTVGFFKPRILVPQSFLQTATAEEWTAMLAHELAHVHRKDFARNLFCELFYLPICFHPAAMLMKSRLACAREMACDELAIERSVRPESYVNSLLSLAKKISAVPSSGSLDYSLGMLDANILEERVMKLLHGNTLSVSWSKAILSLLLAALVALCIPASAYAILVGADKTNATAVQAQTGEDGKIPRVGPGITAPRPISTPDPGYPQAARDAGQQGTVRLWCVIGADGLVNDIRVVKSLGTDLDESALTTVQHWTFEPAMKAGKPIEVQVDVDITFNLYPKAE